MQSGAETFRPPIQTEILDVGYHNIQKNAQSLPEKIKIDKALPWWSWFNLGLDFENAHLQSSGDSLGLVLSSFTLNRWATLCHNVLELAQHYTVDFQTDYLSFAQLCSHLLLESLQSFVWPKFESSQGISSKWNWLSRLWAEDATIYNVWKPQATGISWNCTHACTCIAAWEAKPFLFIMSGQLFVVLQVHWSLTHGLFAPNRTPRGHHRACEQCWQALSWA